MNIFGGKIQPFNFLHSLCLDKQTSFFLSLQRIFQLHNLFLPNSFACDINHQDTAETFLNFFNKYKARYFLFIQENMMHCCESKYTTVYKINQPTIVLQQLYKSKTPFVLVKLLLGYFFLQNTYFLNLGHECLCKNSNTGGISVWARL